MNFDPDGRAGMPGLLPLALPLSGGPIIRFSLVFRLGAPLLVNPDMTWWHIIEKYKISLKITKLRESKESQESKQKTGRFKIMNLLSQSVSWHQFLPLHFTSATIILEEKKSQKN